MSRLKATLLLTLTLWLCARESFTADTQFMSHEINTPAWYDYLNLGAYPYVKIGFGASGSFTSVSASNPLPTTSTGSSPNGAGQINNSTTITSAPTTFTAPANAVGFILESESSNTDNLRWAIGSAASSTVGTLAEPGRDTGYIPLAANISVVALSGTQSASVQWVLSQ